ncbi:MAG: tRNA (guanosine(37)-N1)-methyltransferase TrmD [Candidatus Sungbacteria bacterium]|nr:tRNA (guanosine(37)-N1)-methyltransferase TrmD [Candidatus Sungbacteria bacterium]
MCFDIITIFPEAFESYLNTSILKRAQEKHLIDVRFKSLRDFAKGKYRQVDDKPYGGGAGMVLMAEPILKAVKSLKTRNKKQKTKVIVLSAKGKQFNQKMAYDWARKYNQLILVSGRYEGIDERVKMALKAEEISIGPYVLTDGEVASMVVISAVARLIPGVIRLESLKEESHWKLLLKDEEKIGKGLEYPHYTRPEVLIHKGEKLRVPKVLLSGNHKKIAEWRRKQIS